jgi:hypothetical protein
MNVSKGSLPWAGACYGIDLQAGRLVVVRAERRAGQVSWDPVDPQDPGFREACRAGGGCSGCVSSRESSTRWLDVPFASLSKAAKVLPTLLDIQLPFPLEECVYGFLQEGRREAMRLRKQEARAATRKVLAVVARFQDVERRIAELKARGVDPVMLDHEGLALWTQSLREVPPTPRESDLPRAVVYLGLERSVLVVGRGEHYLGAHGIRTDDDAQIRRFLAVDLEGEPVSRGIRWMWTGPRARDAETVTGILEHLPAAWSGPTSVHEAPETFLARALAVRAVAPGPLRCNLRTDRLTHPEIMRRSRSRSLTAAAACAVAGLLIAGTNLLWEMGVRQRRSAFDRASARLAEDLAGYPVSGRGSDALEMVGVEIEKRTAELAPFYHATRASLLETVAEVMRAGKRQGLHYDVLSIGRRAVSISGSAPDWDRCEAVSRCLAEAGYTVELERQELLDGDRVPFTIRSGGAP